MEARDFAGEAARLLGPKMLSLGGRVLYSEAASLAESADLYYLGINPRDAASSTDPDHHSVRTIGRDLELLASGRTGNAFLDERWKYAAAGSAELQLRVRQLVAWAGVTDEASLRRMPASNLVFVRSVVQPPESQLREWARICWPVHEFLITTTGAKNVFVGGTVAGKIVAELMGCDPSRPRESVRLRTANYSIYVYEARGRAVFVFPPLPRWKGMETVDAGETQRLISRLGRW
jgi:hypothetical protein